ncbi:MAG: SipW-dependent-type signal peptide-containing protein [Oscillospiraceae bacterium]|nr:SipW-dependent-type signal peptide-containing protein [Oscillospiraceae bacterium]
MKKQNGQKNALLQTYLTSLLSLMLCVSMFFGTTMAWFTSTAQSPLNQIVVGTLDVELYHASFRNGEVTGEYAKVTPEYKVLDPEVKWEPGYTAVEKFKVVNTGELEFGYHMTISMPDETDEAAKPVNDAIAQAVTVWAYSGTDTDTLPANYELMTVSGEWVRVGTLYEVINEKLPLFRGEIHEKDGQAFHMIALHLEKSFAGEIPSGEGQTSLQGEVLDNITITLVASQIAGGTDAFGSGYDATPTELIVKTPWDAENGCTLTAEAAGTSISAVNVVVPAEVALVEGTEQLTLTLKEVEQPAFTVAAGKSVLSLELDVAGIAEENTAPIAVSLNIARGLTSVDLYHEGQPVQNFTYDPDTGLLTFETTGFSQFDVTYGTEYVSTRMDLEDALEEGRTVLMMDNIAPDAMMVMNGGSLNGNGKVLDATLITGIYDCAITTSRGTVKNLTILGNPDSTRAIGSGSSGDYTLSGDLMISNVVIDYVQYAINGNGDGKGKVVVRDSEIYGWCSFSNIASFEFIDCTLGTGNSDLGYQVIYGNTTYTDCHFEEFDLCAADTVAADSKVIFNNCTYGDEMVTADNFIALFKYPGDDADFNKLRACTILVNGEKVVWPEETPAAPAPEA